MDHPRIIFGTDGWRGLLEQELNEQNIQRVAQALADYMRLRSVHNRIVIGYDGRRDSDHFASVFAKVLKGNVIEVILSDRIVPTPVVSFTCRRMQCDVGVMVTASHNPPTYNGIKFKAADGSPFATEQTALVEMLIDNSMPAWESRGIVVSDLLTPYLEHIENLIDFQSIAASCIRPLIDSMAGAGQQILGNLLKKYNIVSSTIFGQADQQFNGRLAEPVERNLQPLAEALREGDFSLGLATDGDADRLGVMTNSGQWMNVQETILYLAQYYKGIRGIQGPLVKTASVTDKMLHLFPGDAVVDVQVGFKYVAEAMVETAAVFGAEESGGFGFKEHLPERDGIFSALLFMEMLALSGFSKLDDFIAHKRKQLGQIHYERIDLENDDPQRHELLPHLTKNPPNEIGGYAVSNITSYINSRGVVNGLKICLSGQPRWLLVRVSETEPIVRIYAEGETDNEVKNLLQSGKELFQKTV